MANSSQNLDKVFKEKLDQHSIKPSALAWERLEKQLPKEPKSNKGFWWAAAASVVILLSAGYFLYPDDATSPKGDMLATNEKIDLPKTIEPTESQEIESIPTEETKPETATEPVNTTASTPAQKENKNNTTTKKQPAVQPKATEEAPQNLIAMTETQEETVETKPVAVPELKLEEKEMVQTEIQLTAPDMSKTIAEAKPTEEAPAFRVKIYSDGLKEEPKDKSLIAGIGKTVNEVEGLLGKVDQGFADLQDAKNNLFTSMISKKERAEK